MLRTEDLQHEEEIQRNPYNLKAWWTYLDAKRDAPPVDRYVIFERSLKFLPRSYKLWHAYLQERAAKLAAHSIADKRFAILENTFERALVNLYKMPRIWLDYCELLVQLSRGTTARRAFDRALQALPITQHKKIWVAYIKWAKSFGVGETCVRVYRRYLMYDSSSREDFVQYLLDVGQHEEAARQLSICVSDDHFISSSGKSRHQLWMQLCDLCAEHPQSVSRSLKVDAIIRSGIVKFSDEVGHLWCRLADYYVRMGQFEKARDIYEEAMNSVTTVRDFSVVFDSYVKVEESILSAKMNLMDQSDDTAAAAAGDDGEDVAGEAAEEVEMRLARLEFLMDQRPLLLSSVVLRQNPHNVFEWHKRAKLFAEDPQRTLMTYIEGIKTVDPKLASGKLSGLWLALARFYEKHEDLDNARIILDKATKVDFKGNEELANVYCAWGELELLHEEYDKALSVMQQAVAEPVSSVKRRKAAAAAQGRGKDGAADAVEGSVAADRVHKNVRVWNLYLDLEENLGTVETCRAAYERAFDIKVITPQMTLNYAAFLEERDFFEDSFRVYERAVALFMFPQVKALWLKYLDKFITRYGGTKLERLRDLFEQSVSKVPPEDAAEFFIKYAKTEEQFGLARHALAVYDRATRIVPEASRLDMYRLYIKKVEQFYGITKTRSVYERAVAELDDVQSRLVCLEFANMERKLGEIDRARAIFQHGAQFADPRKEPGYWRQWREFEESHGNEDTFREMLRIQRSVETAYSQVNYLAAELVAGETVAAAQASTASGIEGLELSAERDALSRRGRDSAADDVSAGQKRKFVPASSSTTTADNSGGGAGSAKVPAVDRGDGLASRSRASAVPIDDADGVDDGTGSRLEQRSVPAAVFGSMTAVN